MTDYILYFNGSKLYCYRHGNYVSYWRTSVTTAVTCSLSYMETADIVYYDDYIIYRSHLPITSENYPEYFL